MPVGPLKHIGRNRLFFFTSFEFNPSKTNTVVTLEVPATAEAAGNFAGVVGNSSQAITITNPGANHAAFANNQRSLRA